MLPRSLPPNRVLSPDGPEGGGVQIGGCLPRQSGNGACVRRQVTEVSRRAAGYESNFLLLFVIGCMTTKSNIDNEARGPEPDSVRIHRVALAFGGR